VRDEVKVRGYEGEPPGSAGTRGAAETFPQQNEAPLEGVSRLSDYAYPREL